VESHFYHPAAVSSEDCLRLNVWTPGVDGARAVLVWIHGGAYLAGSGTGLWYDGTSFARAHDVVVVTINYRLGALGFLTLPDRRASSDTSAMRLCSTRSQPFSGSRRTLPPSEVIPRACASSGSRRGA
jgi:para-nitrobenzyl esterase